MIGMEKIFAEILIDKQKEVIAQYEEIIKKKNEIVENRKYLIIIKEHLKADEKEIVKKPVSYPIMPNNELKNYTEIY